MADTAISALTAGTEAQAADAIPVARSGANRRLTPGMVANPSAGYGTPPAASSFTWVNQGGASVADTTQGFTLSAPSSASVSVRALVLAASAPWTLAANVVLTAKPSAVPAAEGGLCVRDSATGRMYIFGFQSDNTLQLYKLTNATTYSSTPAFSPLFPFGTNGLWLRIRDDNTNLYFDAGPDGETWLTMFQEVRTTWTAAPDQHGVFCDVQNSFAAALSVRSWKVS